MEYNFFEFSDKTNYPVIYNPILDFEYFENLYDSKEKNIEAGCIYFIDGENLQKTKKIQNITVCAINFDKKYINPTTQKIPILNNKELISSNCLKRYSAKFQLSYFDCEKFIDFVFYHLDDLTNIILTLNYIVEENINIDSIDFFNLGRFEFPSYTQVLKILTELSFKYDYGTTIRIGSDHWEHYHVYINNIPDKYICEMILNILQEGEYSKDGKFWKIKLRSERYYNFKNLDFHIIMNFDKYFRMDRYINFLLKKGNE